MTHSKPHNQDAALDTFVGNLTEISAILVRLQSTVDDLLGVAPESVNWGHVGDTAQIASQLRDISNRLFNEGEHVKQVTAKEYK